MDRLSQDVFCFFLMRPDETLGYIPAQSPGLQPATLLPAVQTNRAGPVSQPIRASRTMSGSAQTDHSHTSSPQLNLDFPFLTLRGLVLLFVFLLQLITNRLAWAYVAINGVMLLLLLDFRHGGVHRPPRSPGVLFFTWGREITEARKPPTHIHICVCVCVWDKDLQPP